MGAGWGCHLGGFGDAAFTWWVMLVWWLIWGLDGSLI